MNNVCCFFGHRKIEDSLKLREKLNKVIEDLIISKNIDTFLFGSKSQFDSLCHELVTQMKEKYPHIKRIYVRAEYPYIDESYKTYLLERYEDTYYPESIISATRAVYVMRNYHMIDNSSVCVVYFSQDYKPKSRRIKSSDSINDKAKSGTKIAYDYAEKKSKLIINVFK